MNSLMASYTHGVGVIQRNDNPRVLFPELLVKTTPGHPRLFGHSRDLIRGKDLRLLRGNPCKLLADSCIEFDLVRLKLRAVVKGRMLLVDSLATNLREELSQGGTCIYMAPAFRRLGELDDWHGRGHLDTGLLPGPADAMTGNTQTIRPKGFGELCFDLPTKVT